MPSTPVPKWLVISFLLLGFIGFIDAGYLTAKYYLGSPVNCAILKGCEIVTSSKFAMVAGVPIALAGAIYYLVIIFLALLYLDAENKTALIAASLISLAGFIASLWLLYIQLFILNALCLYCLASLATTTVLFINGLFLLKYKQWFHGY